MCIFNYNTTPRRGFLTGIGSRQATNRDGLPHKAGNRSVEERERYETGRVSGGAEV